MDEFKERYNDHNLSKLQKAVNMHCLVFLSDFEYCFFLFLYK